MTEPTTTGAEDHICWSATAPGSPDTISPAVDRRSILHNFVWEITFDNHDIVQTFEGVCQMGYPGKPNPAAVLAEFLTGKIHPEGGIPLSNNPGTGCHLTVSVDLTSADRAWEAEDNRHKNPAT